jgi:hypothetical protein
MPRKGQKKGNRIEILGGVGLIHLNRGIALIDVEDIERAKGYTWHNRGSGIATTIPGTGKVYLSRLILFGNKHLKEKRMADHKNHNPFDCRKQNLRPATNGQNQHNQALRNNASSQYKGVSWLKHCQKWQAEIQSNKKRKYLGVYCSEIQAAEAYDAAARMLNGEYAFVNF